MPVSDETKDFLEEAKKGKARKFVMLVKGTSITSFIVYKKGNATKFIKQAKEDGKGLPYFGLITGKGMDLNFQLAIDDGFDKSPVKDLILKKFLEDEADFKCKPLIEIVQTRGVALDPDDPLHARFLKLQTAALEACDKHPGEANKIGALCQKIGGLLDEDQRDPATTEIGNLEKLLADLVRTGPTLDPEVDKQRKTFESLSAKLEPMLLDVQKAVPDKALALGNVWTYAQTQGAASNFAAANKALAGLADALTKAKSGPTANVDVLAIWVKAKESADTQLNRFADALRKSGDDYLVKIAEGGVHSFVEGPTRVFVSLQAALMDYQRAQGPARDTARNKILAAITEYDKFLAGSKFIAICDANELCGPLTIRDTLKNSLAQLEKALAA